MTKETVASKLKHNYMSRLEEEEEQPVSEEEEEDNYEYIQRYLRAKTIFIVASKPISSS